MSSLLRGDIRLDVHGVRRPGAQRFETEQVVAAGLEETFAFEVIARVLG